MVDFIFYGGKGGVGKTTCAAATGLKLAERGEDTLVVSTDPAHSLSDAFDNEVPSRPEEIRDHLWAVEVDPEEAMREYKEKLDAMPDEMGAGEGGDEGGMFGGMFGGDSGGTEDAGMGMGDAGPGMGGLGGGMDDMLDESMMGPGSDEAAAMDKFMEYMDSDRWDRIVFDTAPTGHTLRLLQLPEIMESTVGKIIKIRTQFKGLMESMKGMFGGEQQEVPSSEDLDELKARIERVRSMMRDPMYTDFRVVMVPEKMSALETQRMIEQLSRYEIPVKTVVINKVMEEVNEDCEFCQSRWKVQQENIEEANTMFRDLDIQYVPLMTEDVHGFDSLEKVAERIEVE